MYLFIVTGVARLSSARVVRCLVYSFNERNSYFYKIIYFKKDKTLKLLLSCKKTINDKLTEVRTKSSPCGPYRLGYTRATMKITEAY